MENATKALLIAGGALIAIILITLAVILYSTYSKQSEGYAKINEDIEIQKYNSKFDVYIGRKDISAQEVASAIGLAKEYNYQVKIFIDKIEQRFDSENTAEKFISENIMNNEGKKTTFSCGDAEYSDTTGKITEVNFTKSN